VHRITLLRVVVYGRADKPGYPLAGPAPQDTAALHGRDPSALVLTSAGAGYKCILPHPGLHRGRDINFVLMVVLHYNPPDPKPASIPL